MDEEKKVPGLEPNLGDAERGSKGKFSKGKGKGKRGNRRGFGKGTPSKGGNDFAFWNEYPELMGIAAKYPWFHIAGTPLYGNGVDVKIPNVAVQHYFSVPGVCNSATDPLNLAFRQVYLDLHRKYRGVGSYQASDIAIAFLCIESVNQLIVEAERNYGILKGYPIRSRIEPEGLLRAMGYNASFIATMKSNLANYRYSLNRIIELAKRLPLPSGMNFFQNHIAMNGFVYRDSKDVRSGLLVFVFDNYYTWEGAGSSYMIHDASTAKSRAFVRSSFNTPDDLFRVIEDTLDKLLLDTDILRITSDFIACYGDSNMQVLAPLPEDYKVEPVYSESMLMKWHNSERFGGTHISYHARAISDEAPKADGGFYVYQLQDVIHSEPVISADTQDLGWTVGAGGNDSYYADTTGVWPIDQLLTVKGYVNDTWLETPTDEAACESVLWKGIFRGAYSAGGTAIPCFMFEEACTEFLTDLEVKAVSNSQVVSTALYETSMGNANTSSVDDGLMHFDWHPYIFDTNNGGSIVGIMGDTDNVTVVSKETITKILDAALLSAFKVRISGKSGE